MRATNETKQASQTAMVLWAVNQLNQAAKEQAELDAWADQRLEQMQAEGYAIALAEEEAL